MTTNKKKIFITQTMSPRARALLTERNDIELVEFPNLISAPDFEAMLREHAPVHGVALRLTQRGQAIIPANVPVTATVTKGDKPSPLIIYRTYAGVQAVELKGIEQQADRAVALAKGIAGLVRESPSTAEPWILLEQLLNEIFNDFTLVMNSGLLTLERQWDAFIQVPSSPVLRHLLVFFLSKLVGSVTRPMVLTVAAAAGHDGRCRIDHGPGICQSIGNPPRQCPSSGVYLTYS